MKGSIMARGPISSVKSGRKGSCGGTPRVGKKGDKKPVGGGRGRKK